LPERPEVRQENQAGLPEWSTSAEMTAYWTDRLCAGFVPEQAQEALGKALQADPDVEDRRKLEALLSLTADPLGKSHELPEAPEVPVFALRDGPAGRLFVSGAAGAGLTCLEYSSGRKLWHLDSEQLGRPGGMALADELLLVCDRWKNRVLAVSAADGTLRWTLENAGEKNLLNEPASLTLVEKAGTREIWVIDRSNHRICRYSLQGEHLGNIGRRGLVAEEIIWNNARSPDAPEAVFLEFPEAIMTGKDIDKKMTVFVWDSGNCRILCLSRQGALKRTINLETGAPAGHRHALRLSLFDSPSGPIPAAIDEADNAFLVWTSRGELIMRAVLGPALFGRITRAETARIVADPDGNRAVPALITSKAAVVELRKEALDLPVLLRARAAVQADRPPWLLALWESQPDAESKNDVLKEFWSGPPAGMDAEALACSLLSQHLILDGRLSQNLARIEALIAESGRAGFEEAATELSRAVDRRLKSLAGKMEDTLLEQALPNADDLDAWSESQTLLDLALFKFKGNNQAEAIRQDSTLDPMHELPDSTRRAGWTYRFLSRELAGREKDHLQQHDRALRLAFRGKELLDRRAGKLRNLERQIDFNVEPNKVRPEELRAIHRCLITVQSINRVTGILADEIAASVNGRETSGQLTAELRACARLTPGGGRWQRLLRENIGESRDFTAPDVEEPAGESSPEVETGRLEHLRSLIENVSNYLKLLNENGVTGSGAKKVVARQKEIFALKAALLISFLRMDGCKARELEELTERARKLAGTCWEGIAEEFLQEQAAGDRP